MFSLASVDLSQGVLDCGGGPASFAAEVSECGYRAVSVDPIYAHSGSEILARFEVTAEPMLSQVRATPADWTWSLHRGPDDLLATRRTAIEVFLADYERGLRERRYVLGEFALPSFRFRVVWPRALFRPAVPVFRLALAGLSHQVGARVVPGGSRGAPFPASNT